MDRVKARAASTPNPLGFLHRPIMVDANGLQNMSNTQTGTTVSQRQRDPNCTDGRLLLNQRCIYERRLPGSSYITAHIARLQKGYYDSPVVHGDRVENCRFVAINFVFHPTTTLHRFVSARISISLQDRDAIPTGGIPLPPQIDHPNNARPSLSGPVRARRKPRFLRHAPHLLYGALSPETLDWTFNLAGSIGVAQGPANASINPSGGVKSSYKVYKMMKIQGSVRTLNSWHGHEFDVEDGSLVWTLEENDLQKSGLPREFTFVMLFTKGDAPDVVFDIDIEPVVGSWYGTYPKWWIDRIWYRPLHKEPLDIDVELGQKFGPATKNEGFNFASLMGSFDDFVTLPGTTYSKTDQGGTVTGTQDDGGKPGTGQRGPGRQLSASPAPNTANDYNIRVFLEGYSKSPSNDPLSSLRQTATRAQSPPVSNLVISRSRNRDRSRPRSEHYPSPPVLDSTSVSKPRPVSAIYENTAPVLSSNTPEMDPPGLPRPLSSATDISDELFVTPLSPIPALQITKLLRHSRSRPDLQEDLEGTKSRPARSSQRGTMRATPIEPEDLRDSRSMPIRQAEPKPSVLRYPRRPGAQPMRRTSNETKQQSQPRIQPQLQDQSRTQVEPQRSSASDTNETTILRPQDPNIANTLNSPTKRLTPRQARNSAYINPVDINHARFKLAEDSPTLPPPPQPPSFPPTSFPGLAPTLSTPLNSNPPTALGAGNPTAPADAQTGRTPAQLDKILPPAPMLPPSQGSSGSSLHGLGVDTIVQQEVTNYLRAHPELYSPHSSAKPLLVLGEPSAASASRARSGSATSAPTMIEYQDTLDEHEQQYFKGPEAKFGRHATGIMATNKNRSNTTQHDFDFAPVASHTNARPNTATGTNNNSSHKAGLTRGGPSSTGGGGMINTTSNSSSSGGGRHRRSQSVNPTVGHTNNNSTISDFDNGLNGHPNTGFRDRDDRERAHTRKIKDAASNGEFIRVSVGGVGHGGWEYLE